MILSVKGTATRQLIEAGKSKFGGINSALAMQRLSELDAADSLAALGALKSVGLHKSRRDRAGHWAIKINGPWRIVFRFVDGNAYDVDIVDYH